jgi:hypothetical protein
VARRNSEFYDDPEDHAAVLDMLVIHYHATGNAAAALNYGNRRLGASTGSGG